MSGHSEGRADGRPSRPPIHDYETWAEQWPGGRRRRSHSSETEQGTGNDWDGHVRNYEEDR